MSAYVEPIEIPCKTPDGDLVHLNLNALVDSWLDQTVFLYNEVEKRFEMVLTFDTASCAELVSHKRRTAQKGQEVIELGTFQDFAMASVKFLCEKVRRVGYPHILPEHRPSDWEMLVASAPGDRNVPFWVDSKDPGLVWIDQSNDAEFICNLANRLSYSVATDETFKMPARETVVLGRWVVGSAIPMIDGKDHVPHWRSAISRHDVGEAALLLKYWPLNYSDPHAAIGQFWRMASESDNLSTASMKAGHYRMWQHSRYSEPRVIERMVRDACGHYWRRGSEVGDHHDANEGLRATLRRLLPWERNFGWAQSQGDSNPRGIVSTPFFDEMAFFDNTSLDSIRRGARPGGLTNAPFLAESDVVRWNRPEEASNRVFSEELLRHAVQAPRLTAEQRMRMSLVSPATAGIHPPIEQRENPWAQPSVTGLEVLGHLHEIASRYQGRGVLLPREPLSLHEARQAARGIGLPDIRDVARDLGLPEDSFQNEYMGVPPKDEDNDEEK